MSLLLNLNRTSARTVSPISGECRRWIEPLEERQFFSAAPAVAGGHRQQDRPQRDELVAVDEHQRPEEHEDRQDTDGDGEDAGHMILNENIPAEWSGAPAS